MDNELEVQEPQNTPEVEAPNADVVTLSKKELEDIKHRADVSSQNYERAKKAESRVKELESIDNLTDPSKDELFSSKDEVVKLKGEISDIKGKLTKSEVLEAHPVLKEVWGEFEKYHSDPENSGMGLKTAAKAFLVEKGLLDQQRKGLEKPTGGTRTPPTSGMNSEEVKKLRETNYRKYSDMIRKGQISV